ncbi:protein-tyrosine phosphatase-like protein [Aspergillus ambiguus]|uniref:putative phosphatidylinositol-3,4,5-trisphosphate 3-phosphatase n=1 Tax=Aspergillus ambiguus TaxID=176160 RepID=UPI003CCDFAE4
MASLLRQIVAGPRLQHPEAGLDLCYVTDNIIATSGPSSNYPQRAYRNPLDELVAFLDAKHGPNWCIWEFRAEGTGYPDDEVYGRIHHYPWPDHHPPPFALIPAMMGSMKNWLRRLDGSSSPSSSDGGHRVAVVHCKAGKGRSGTVACSYLISQEGWTMDDALRRFTERRMRVGFGPGVSIPSQLRWVGYVDRWANRMQKTYVERPVEILELEVWGLRDGVKVAVEGFVDEGKKIKCFHLFHRSERSVIDAGDDRANPPSDSPAKDPATPTSSSGDTSSPPRHMSGIRFRPKTPVILPSSDVNIDFERRSKAAYTGWAMVTSIAHIWFNAYFEGGDQDDSGVFEAEWDALDGIKGTTKKGIRALDRLRVVWRYPHPSQLGVPAPAGEDAGPVRGTSISEPKPGESIPESHAADWRGRGEEEIQESLGRDQEGIPVRVGEQDEQRPSSPGTDRPTLTGIGAAAAGAPSAAAQSVHGHGKELGLRKQTDESQDVSLAESDDNSPVLGRKRGGKSEESSTRQTDDSDLEGVRPYFGNDDAQKAPSDKKEG